MKIKILKEDIVGGIKESLDPILAKEKVFESGNFRNTNIKIEDIDRKNSRLKDYNSEVHYEFFFKGKEQEIIVGIHFVVIIEKAKILF
ncbi:MAG TPA: hypothetical protein VGK10_15435 [Prolixibacteraceae bacterium]|jgi:hypothetical protein